MSDQLAAGLTLAGLTVGLIGAVYGAWRHYRPSVKRAGAALDAIIGKEATLDRAGNLIEPSQPGLVHRVATVEEAVVELRHVTALYIETQKRIDHHDLRLKALEDARVERLITQAESAHMWRAVADKDIEDAPE